MEATEKLYELRNVLGPEEDAEDSILLSYLEQAKAAILYRMNQYMTDEEYEEAEVKAKVLGYLRFLAILIIEKKKEQNEVKEREIRHAVDRLNELALKVPELGFLKG